MAIVLIEHMCPLFMMGYFAGGEGLPVSDMYCISEGCQLWDKENEVCSIKSISQELSRVREQLPELARLRSNVLSRPRENVQVKKILSNALLLWFALVWLLIFTLEFFAPNHTISLVEDNLIILSTEIIICVFTVVWSITRLVRKRRCRVMRRL